MWKAAITSTLLVSAFFPCFTLAAQPDITKSDPMEGLWEKITIALIAALFGFIANYILDLIRKKREARKRLTIETAVTKGFITQNAAIRDKITILYNRQPVHDLYQIACNIENSGNQVIKKQHLRFEVSGPAAKIIESFFDTEPEPELGVEAESQVAPHERRFSIKHLEKGKRVGFRFFVSASAQPALKVHPLNEEGNVDYPRPGLLKLESDQYHLRKLINLGIVFIIIPPILHIIPHDQLGSAAEALVRFGIAILMIPHIGPSAGALSELIKQQSIPIPTELHDSQSVTILAKRDDGGELHVPVPVYNAMEFQTFLDKVYWRLNAEGENIDEYTYGKDWVLVNEQGTHIKKLGDLREPDERRIMDAGITEGARYRVVRLRSA